MITVVVIIILALVAFASSTRMIDEANYSTYSNNFSEVETFFEKTSVNMHGSDLIKDTTKRDEQIYNFVAKGGSGEADFLSMNALPGYTVIKENADIGIDIPVTKVESGTGHMIPIKYATTKNGEIFNWPPYEYGDKLYVTKVDTVGHKMQTEITVGGEKVQIKIDPIDGSLMDADVEQKPLPNNPVVPEKPDVGGEEEHDFSGKIQSDEYLASAATCVAPARYYYKCLQCSAKSTETYAVGAGLGHSYGDWKTNGTPTCASAAERTKTCSRCGDTQRETLEKDVNNHVGGETSTTVAATCTKEGSKTYKCASCGVTKRTETIEKDKNNHGTNEKKEVIVDATCTKEGSKTYTCSGCSATLSTETIAALNHDWSGYTVTTPATCTTTGIKTRTCSRCGSKETATIQKDSSNHHNGDVKTSTTDATCTTAGKIIKTCTLCGGTLSSETIAALGHIDANKDSKCDRCGAIMGYDAGTIVFKSDGKAYLYGENNSILNTYTGWMTATYSAGNKTPWYAQRESIKAVVIEDGVNPSSTAYWFDCYYSHEYYIYYKNLATVTFGNGITTIGKEMFNDCLNLKTVNFSDSIMSIGYYAFNECESLNTLNLPKNLTYIDQGAFRCCEGLTSIVIPDKVTELGSGAFYECINVATLTIGKSVAKIGQGAFRSLECLKQVTIPDSVKSVGQIAFAYSDSLESITIGSGTTTFSYDALQDCMSLKTINVKSGNSSYSATNGVLYNKNKSLLIFYAPGKTETEFTIPSTVTRIGVDAFRNAKNLKKITVNSNIDDVGAFAFEGTTNFSEIYVNASVTKFEAETFLTAENVKTVNVSSASTTYCSVNNVIYTKDMKTLIYRPQGLTDTSYTVPSSITRIEAYACARNKLQTVILPSGLLTIGNDAFSGAQLTGVTIPNKVTTLEDSAFYNCDNITTVTVPNSVTYMESYVFMDCGKLTNATLGTGLSRMATGCFKYCTNLTSVTFKDTTTWYYGNIPQMNSYSGGTLVDVSDPATIATKLKGTTSMYMYKID
ncbi:MAG: leucine-rich repeat domain-containing protein [Clostridia bacterium]|nr:leucine-rich repeat domain-containing protein [Clostridia bacterium]